MKQDTREQMIEGALTLLAKQGLQATSFSEVLKLTKAPRGSIYYHFPGGKDQLVSEALKLSEKRNADSIRAISGDDVEEITEGFLSIWRYLLLAYEFSVGCPALAVAVATDSPELLRRSDSIFETWQTLLTVKFVNTGVLPNSAADFATTLIASTEGSVVMSRAAKNIRPFERAATQLIDQAKNLK